MSQGGTFLSPAVLVSSVLVFCLVIKTVSVVQCSLLSQTSDMSSVFDVD